ncbi:uncharacterized protein RAG0_04616 [Rhynchosporium agropyri]|uniref:Uncharacterized protein n=1 Tax=Rhynchosporium agropyri TaxID=914238 RepID=A0A1E1K9E0_9HELO|nr:uncharacterized protein RAG0_04616 [Rhynchosporium agropyri]
MYRKFELAVFMPDKTDANIENQSSTYTGNSTLSIFLFHILTTFHNLNIQNSGQQIIPKNMPISYLFYKLKDGESRHKAIVSEALVSKDAVKSSQWKLTVEAQSQGFYVRAYYATQTIKMI